MPKKLGNGGEGLEEFNPNDGQYIEDGVPNKSYDNPEEEKVLNAMGLNLSDKIENKQLYLRHLSPTSVPEYCAEKIHNLIESVNDNQYKNILLNYMKQKTAKIDFGNHNQGSYDDERNKISVGYYVYEKKENYWVFFHEEGHSIDRNYGDNSFLSDSFIGSDGKTLLKCMVEDANENIKQLLNDYEMHEKKHMQTIFKEKNIKPYTLLKQEFENNKKNKPTEIYYEMQKLSIEANKMIKGKTEEEIDEIMNSKIFLEMQKKFNELNEERNNWIKAKDFPTEEEYIEENFEYSEALTEAKRKASEDYKCLSDAISSLFGKPLNIYMHPQSYWEQNKNLKNEEFFANAFECLIQENNESKLLEKYFPRSMKVVKEMLQYINEEQMGANYYE